MAQLDLTTVANIKILNPAITGSTKDAQIGRLITGVSRRFEIWLGCEFLKAARVEVFSVRAAETVFHLKAFPVDTTVDVLVRNEFSGVWANVADMSSVNYYVDDLRGRILFRDQYTALITGPGTLRISYTGGLATSTAAIPAAYFDLQMACEMQVLHDLQRAPNFGSSQRTVGGGGQSFDHDEKYDSPFIPDVVDALEQYRRGAGVN